MKTISERLKFILKDNGIPERDVMNAMKLSVASFQKKMEKNLFNIEDINNFCSTYREIDFAWLTTGMGNPYKKEPSKRDVYDYTGVNEMVKAIRKENGLSQQEMAQILGISRTTMSAIERNVQTIQIAQMRILHRKFKVPYEMIIDQTANFSFSKAIKDCEEKVEQYKRILLNLNVDESLL